MPLFLGSLVEDLWIITDGLSAFCWVLVVVVVVVGFFFTSCGAPVYIIWGCFHFNIFILKYIHIFWVFFLFSMWHMRLYFYCKCPGYHIILIHCCPGLKIKLWPCLRFQACGWGCVRWEAGKSVRTNLYFFKRWHNWLFIINNIVNIVIFTYFRIFSEFSLF